MSDHNCTDPRPKPSSILWNLFRNYWRRQHWCNSRCGPPLVMSGSYAIESWQSECYFIIASRWLPLKSSVRGTECAGGHIWLLHQVISSELIFLVSKLPPVILTLLYVLYECDPMKSVQPRHWCPAPAVQSVMPCMNCDAVMFRSVKTEKKLLGEDLNIDRYM